ncbi:MAG: YceI family protein, partial [Allobranchiibius sp.]
MSTTLKDLDGTYTIDPAHSAVGFVARHAMVTKVRGTFTDVEGSATTGANLHEAKVSLNIAVASVDTRDAKRD